ncbi:MAG TPA: amidase [Actinomycetota bacterium]|nr:amidase [Actinomycetota bacterium]
MREALGLGIGGLRGALERGELAAPEAVAAALERAESEDLNAFVETRPIAVEEAVAAGGPLAGIPLAVKDMFVDRDRVPTCGSGAHGSWLTGTAVVVERLRAAGAAVVGYTNLHEWGVGTTSAYTRTGPILNPRDRARIAGGSSGGSAAALAAGIVPAAIGTDAGGSIRVPSACCGVTGLKPTHGRVPMDGFVGEGGTIDHVGPLARSVGDVALLLGVMAGEEIVPEDASGLRLGIARSFFFDDLDPRVADAVESAVEVLRDVAAEVREVDLPSAAVASFAVPGLLLPLFAGHLEDALTRDFELLQPATRQVLELGRGMGPGDVEEADAVRQAVTADWQRVFDEVDVVVTPTIPAPPAALDSLLVELPSGETSAELAHLRTNAPMNLGGVPALSVPCGELPGGLTTSVTLTAARGRDEAALGLGLAFERATDGIYTDRVTEI